MLGNSAAPHACTFGGERTMDSMFGGAQFVPRRSTKAGHQLKIETKNKAGKVVHKIRCRICKNLFSYHNSSWTTASNHVVSHNIYTIEDIASAALLASQAEQSGEPFPIYTLPTPTAIKKDAPGNV